MQVYVLVARFTLHSHSNHNSNPSFAFLELPLSLPREVFLRSCGWPRSVQEHRAGMPNGHALFRWALNQHIAFSQAVPVRLLIDPIRAHNFR